jgi:serine/threonine-protein kinase
MPDLSKGIELANRYTLVKKLGAGGAAQSWLATDRLTRASVALKLLVSDRAAPESLRKEWQTSIRLMHAHIVRVFEFHEDTDPVFYSLQYIDGPDISVLSGAPLEHVLAPIALIADALRYAHGKGVVHRDIKADNVLLDYNGAPYLIDFGVAGDGSDAVSGGALIAASPQRLAGEPPQPADDIFSLGGLIYELVSGASPYSSASTASDISYVEPPILKESNGSPIPVSVQRLIQSMLDKDAAARPDAATVVAAIESAGFAPGPAPASYCGGRQSPGDEIIEVGETAHKKASRATDGSAAEISKSSGISMRSLGIGLAPKTSMI